MSRLGDIEATVVAKIAGIVPNLTVYSGPRAFDQAGLAFPHVQTYNPGRERAPLDLALGQTRLADTFYTVAFNKDDHDRETVLGYADAIVDAIDADPTLGGQVERSWVAVDGFDETTDEKRTALNLNVSAEVER